MTKLLPCRIEDEIGHVTECILSDRELLDLLADMIRIKPDLDPHLRRALTAVFVGPLWNQDQYTVDDWTIKWEW